MKQPYQGPINFKIYIPGKPTKYGLFIIPMCDIEVLDTYFSLLYSGKLENPDQFYVLGTDEKTHYNLSKDTSIRGRNISMDRYFTSIPLSEWLLDKNITFVGTLQKKSHRNYSGNKGC